MRLRRIGPLSAARFGFWFGLATFLAQIIVGLVLLALNGVPPTRLPPEIRLEIAKIMFITGLFTAFSIFVFAMIYNWSSDAFGGGLELEFEVIPPVEEIVQD